MKIFFFYLPIVRLVEVGPLLKNVLLFTFVKNVKYLLWSSFNFETNKSSVILLYLLDVRSSFYNLFIYGLFTNYGQIHFSWECLFIIRSCVIFTRCLHLSMKSSFHHSWLTYLLSFKVKRKYSISWFWIEFRLITTLFVSNLWRYSFNSKH